MHGPCDEARGRRAGHHKPGINSSKVLARVEDTRRRGLRDLEPETSANGRSTGFVTLVGVPPPARRFGVSSVLLRPLWVTVVAANHRRSLHRPRSSCNLSDLTLYEPPLLAALGEFPVKPLEARLLDVQSAREGV